MFIARGQAVEFALSAKYHNRRLTFRSGILFLLGTATAVAYLYCVEVPDIKARVNLSKLPSVCSDQKFLAKTLEPAHIAQTLEALTGVEA
jgi:hypothetical protein